MFSITAAELDNLAVGVHGSTVKLTAGANGPELRIHVEPSIHPADSAFPVTVELAP